MNLLNRTKIQSLIILVVSVFMLNSCGDSGAGSVSGSSATGWKINSAKNGGFYANTRYSRQQAGPGLVFIEGGAFTMGRVQDDFMADWNNSPTKQHVRSFFMDQNEVTNLDYKEYLYWISRVFPSSEENYKYIYLSALPDTLVWRNRLGANEAFVENYFRHPAYNMYPVVGVTWIQATKYATWRTDRVNEKILIDRGIMNEVNGSPDNIVTGEDHFSTKTYLSDPTAVFKSKDQEVYKKGLPDLRPKEDDGGDFKGRHVKIEDGMLLPSYRLPTEVEWEYAAVALIGNREFNTIKGKKKFPWNGKTAKSKNPKTKGDLLANFKVGRGDYSGIAGWSGDGADITNRVRSYPPNDYGLYDMAGNVAEWVADVYRPVINEDGNDFSYFRGNVFEKKVVDENGETEYVTGDNIKYDTLSDGRLIPHRLPGEVKMAPITSEDTYMRDNYNIADNINFEDGDLGSSKSYGKEIKNSSESTRQMYNSPNNTIKVDASGKLIRSYDKSSKRTSLISNKTRVYKGGSWADRVYWLDPAQRRYMNQDLSTNYIGFRCAMDNIGELSIRKKTPYNK